MRNHLGILGALILAVACGDRSGALSGVPDAEGVLTEEMRIDPYDGNLVPIGAVAVAEDGSIVMTQAQDQLLRFFGPDGEPLGQFGGEGEGPGEFTSMSRLGWLADTLWAYDGRQSRITLISPERTLVRTVRIPIEAGPPADQADSVPHFSFVYPVGVLQGGSIIASLDPGLEAPVPDRFKGKQVVGRLSLDGVVQGVAALIPIGTGNLVLTGAVVYAPFPNAGQSAVSPDGGTIVSAFADLEGPQAETFGVTAVDADGDTIFSRRYPFEPVPISAAMEDSVMSQMAERLPAQLKDEFRNKYSPPPIVPPLQSLLGGRDGTVWVRFVDRGEQREYLVLEPDGDPLGMVTLPTTSRIAVAERNRIWVIERDDVDMESLVRFAVGW